MEKIFTTQKGVICISILFIVCLCSLFAYLVSQYNKGLENLATQQQWTKGKEEFDKAYEIAASDKETPDKILYVPNIVNCIGKNIDQCVASLGQGAKVSTSTTSADGTTLTTIMLTNESSDTKSVAPQVSVSTNKSGVAEKVSFTGSTWSLGYPRLSYSDIIDNFHLVENTLNEAGLNVDIPSVCVPENRALYTSYDTDGTTIVLESYTFSGHCSVNGNKYTWQANPVYDYLLANQTGNLSDTSRYITITIQK